MHTMNDGVNGGSSGTNGHTLSKDIPLEAKLQVVKSEKAFASYAKSLVARPAGSVFSLIEGATPAKKAYTSVQTGEDSHIELNSDLVYCNHSCDPSVVFDMSKMEVRVVDHRDLQAGDALTFFYPSSEWDMAQPFTCECKSENCCGTIDGARNMDKGILQRYWLNPHIERLLADAAQS